MKYRLLIAVVFATTAAFSAQINQMERSEHQDRETILITATRTSQSVASIPENPTVITSDDIAARNFTSAPDVLQKKAGLHIRNYSDNPNRASVDIRGFGENSHGRVLVLVNGRRINRPDLAAVNWSQIPMGNIDRIEVLRGPHSALYGDYAVGGVINIITSRGQEETRIDLNVMGGSYGFNDESIRLSGDLDGTGYAASVGHQSADGYRARSAYETWSGMFSLERDFTDYLGSWVDYSYTDSEYELPGSLTAAQVIQDRRQSNNPDDDAAESFHNLGFGIGLYPNDNNEATVEMGFSRKDIESNFASYFSYNTWQINTYSLSPKYVFSSSPMDKENKLTLGVDLGYDDLDTDLYADRGHTTLNGSTTVEKRTTGAYVYDELHLLDNLILSGGARSEKARYKIKDSSGSAGQPDSSDTHDLEAYDAGITYLPVEQLKLFARFNKLYRLPFLDEQIFYQGYGNGFNKDLNPETGKSYEIGFDFTPVDDLDLQCTLFHMDMNGEIAFAYTNTTTYEGTNFNMDDTRHQGVELSGNWQACERVAIYGNYTFQNVEFTAGPNNGNEVPLVPANLLSAGLDLAILEPLHFQTDVTFTDKQFAGGAVDNSAGTELDSYTLIDIALRYTHAFKTAEMSLFAGIDNLFEEEYSPIGFSYGPGAIDAYYPAPTRTYKAGVKVSF